MLKRKGVTNLMWFILAFVVVLILIVVGFLVLRMGEQHAMKGIDDMIATLRELIA